MGRLNTHTRSSADQYDHYTATVVSPYDDLLAGEVAEIHRRRGGPSLLVDAGTGTARFLIHLAGIEELSGLQMLGTDLFADMIEKGRAAVSEADLGDRIQLCVADVHRMPLGESSADIIVSRSTLHHWADPSAALRELFRLLKPGGVAIVHDVRRDPNPESLQKFNELRRQAGLEPSDLEEKFTVAEVRDFLRRAGLEDVSTVRAPRKGLGALGMSVAVAKPDDGATSQSPPT